MSLPGNRQRSLIALLWLIGSMAVLGQNAYYIGKLHDSRLPAMVTVVAGGSDLDLVFDSGANILLLDAHKSPQLLGKLEQEYLINSNGTKRALEVGLIEKVTFGNKQFSQMRASLGDVTDFSQFMGVPCKGIFPAALLEGSCTFDFDVGELKVFAEGLENDTTYSSEYPLKVRHKLPGITCVVESIPLSLIIDTGSSSCFGLSRQTVTALIKDKVVEMDASKTSKSIGIGEITEGVSSGWFLKGTMMGKDLKGVSFKVTSGNETMGMGWLMGFNFAIDFKNQKLLTKRRAHPAPPIPPEQMTGAVFRYTPEGLLVERLKPGGGAAQNAGLIPGDRLISFEDTSLAGITGYDITSLLRRHANSSLPFTVQKNGVGPQVMGVMQIGGIISEWDFACRPNAQ